MLQDACIMLIFIPSQDTLYRLLYQTEKLNFRLLIEAGSFILIIQDSSMRLLLDITAEKFFLHFLHQIWAVSELTDSEPNENGKSPDPPIWAEVRQFFVHPICKIVRLHLQILLSTLCEIYSLSLILVIAKSGQLSNRMHYTYFIPR